VTGGNPGPVCAVREKFPGDAEALVALARGLGGAFDAAALARLARDVADHAGLVAERSGTHLGFATWATGDGAGSSELTCLAVADAHQRRGVGTVLCEALEERLRSRGVRSLEASLPAAWVIRPDLERARRFLLARGFREVRVDVGHWGPENDRLLLRRGL